MATRSISRTSRVFSGLLPAGSYANEHDYHVLRDGKYLGRLRHYRTLGHDEWFALRGHGHTSKKFDNRAAALRWLRTQ